jgi:MarR family transcriptional repressor of emrRAB
MDSNRTVNLLGALGVALADGQRAAMRGASGLSDTEVAALNVVGNGKGLSIGQVRAALDLTHPGTVRVVDRLVASGLMARGPGADGRTVGLHLTQEGRRAFEAQRRERVGWLDRFAAVLRAEGIEDVEGLLERLLARTPYTFEEGEHLCRLCDERACPQDRCPVTIAVGTDP